MARHGLMNLQGGPYVLLVKPNTFCASKSTMTGSGLTLAQVLPAVSTFEIQLRDSFSNRKTSSTNVILFPASQLLIS